MLRLAIVVVGILVETDDDFADHYAAEADVDPLLVLGAELGAQRRAVGGEPLIANLHRRGLEQHSAQPLLEPRDACLARLFLGGAGVDLRLLRLASRQLFLRGALAH